MSFTALVIVPEHEPLAPENWVGGLPRLQRRILAAIARAQCDVVHVVAGPKHKALVQEIAGDRRAQGKVRVHIRDAEIDAVATVLAQSPDPAWGTPDCVLLGDVYDPGALKRLLSMRTADQSLCLKDAQGRPVLLALPKNGVGSLSLHQWLAAATPVPLQDREFAFVLETGTDLALAQKALFRALTKPIDGPVSKYINRPISKTVTRLTLPLKLIPNHMTAFALVIGLLASYFTVAAGQSHTMAGIYGGAFCFTLSSILDGCDGELARLRFLSSHAGEWFDTVCDDVINTCYFVALGVYLWLTAGSEHFLWLAGVAFVLSWIVVASLYKTLIAAGRASHLDLSFSFDKDGGGSVGPLGWVLSKLHVIMKRDFYALAIPVIVVLGGVRPLFYLVSLAQVLLFVVIVREQWALASGQKQSATVNRTGRP